MKNREKLKQRLEDHVAERLERYGPDRNDAQFPQYIIDEAYEFQRELRKRDEE